jgi:hypothetical protein
MVVVVCVCVCVGGVPVLDTVQEVDSIDVLDSVRGRNAAATRHGFEEKRLLLHLDLVDVVHDSQELLWWRVLCKLEPSSAFHRGWRHVLHQRLLLRCWLSGVWLLVRLAWWWGAVRTRWRSRIPLRWVPERCAVYALVNTMAGGCEHRARVCAHARALW